jgi:hypothetical protein
MQCGKPRLLGFRFAFFYNADTKWMYGRHADAKPSSLDQLKEGWYINCKGTFDRVKLVASACRAWPCSVHAGTWEFGSIACWEILLL